MPKNSDQTQNLRCLQNHGPEVRVDVFLAQELKESTRSQVQSLIKSGLVKVNSKTITKPSYLVAPGDSVECVLERKKKEPFLSYDFPLDIIYEDADLLVINKPAGLTMHPGVGTGSKTLANAVSAKLGNGFGEESGSFRPGIVHRLDKDTTGLVVVARTPEIHAALSKQFADRTVGREYQALVFVTPRSSRIVRTQDSGVICSPIARDPRSRTKMAIVENGRRAVTNWKVLERMSYGALLSVKLETGRTHQIRVHMASIMSPVIGDRTYGDFSALPKQLQDHAKNFGRQALHAGFLAFSHPHRKERLEFSVSPPSDMAELINVFREG